MVGETPAKEAKEKKWLRTQKRKREQREMYFTLLSSFTLCSLSKIFFKTPIKMGVSPNETSKLKTDL
jgi:hypothetical protein